jgi:Icc-related predicted phosphoesterase
MERVEGEFRMRIIVFGDIHMDLGKFRNISEIEAADFIIITGDITNFGNHRKARQIVSAVAEVNNRILALHGNLDNSDVAAYLEDEGLSLHNRGLVVEDIGILGIGGSNPTPFQTPVEYEETELAAFIANGYEQVKNCPHLLLISHAPPLNTKTDKISNGAHVGSSSVRAFIDEKQPALCLCGHIHEARAIDAVGNTQIINPGMIKDGGWVDIRLVNNKVSASLQNC